MHHPFARPVEADGIGRATALAAPPKHEWLEVVKKWQSGARGPAWFLADPRRTDLALVDPQSRKRCAASTRWPFSSQVYLGGIRPNSLRWVVINEPGWFAGEGWHLTPETAGVARADGAGLGRGPIRAWIRPRDGAATMMIGGRHLGSGAGPEALVTVRIDGREIERWTVAPSEPSFLRFIPLAPGTLTSAGRWCVLEVQATAHDGANAGVIAIDQFDLQAPDTPMLGFAEGWQEPEYAPLQGVSWRWASQKAVVRSSVTDRDVELQIGRRIAAALLRQAVPRARVGRRRPVAERRGRQRLRVVVPRAGGGAHVVWRRHHDRNRPVLPACRPGPGR